MRQVTHVLFVQRKERKESYTQLEREKDKNPPSYPRLAKEKLNLLSSDATYATGKSRLTEEHYMKA